jgi:hypothetical protein
VRDRLRVLPFLSVVWLACNGQLFRIQVEESGSTTVEAGTFLEDLLVDFGFDDLVAMDITASQELANQGVEPGDIVESYLDDLSLVATSPGGADLAFLDRVDVYVESPGEERKLVASQSDFPPGVADVAFDLEDVDLTPYIVSKSLTLTTDVTGRRPPQDTVVEARFALSVGVTGQGACNALTP